MSIYELDLLIDVSNSFDFIHCSKTYWRGGFLNICGPNGRFTFNLEGDYSECYLQLQSLRK